MTTSSAVHKQPTLRREPIIPDLVIDDLRDMSRTGNYDRQVLLWLQDGYVNRSLQEHLGEMRDLHKNLAESGKSPEEVRTEKLSALVQFVRETYSSQKAGGRGADLKGYVEAAKTFYETEAARYGSHLQELAEYIEKALANGEKPDLDWHARHAYVSMSKMSSVMGNLESLAGKPAAQEVLRLMQRGIENIHVKEVGGRTLDAGRTLLKIVNQISDAPNKYIEFRDPSKLQMPKREPFDFEPAHRADRSLGLSH